MNVRHVAVFRRGGCGSHSIVPNLFYCCPNATTAPHPHPSISLSSLRRSVFAPSVTLAVGKTMQIGSLCRTRRLDAIWSGRRAAGGRASSHNCICSETICTAGVASTHIETRRRWASSDCFTHNQWRRQERQSFKFGHEALTANFRAGCSSC